MRLQNSSGELSLDIRAIMAILNDGEDVNDLTGESFAFDHEIKLSAVIISHS